MLRAVSFNPANAGNMNASSVQSNSFSAGGAAGINKTIGIPAVATIIVTAGIITSSLP